MFLKSLNHEGGYLRVAFTRRILPLALAVAVFAPSYSNAQQWGVTMPLGSEIQPAEPILMAQLPVQGKQSSEFSTLPSFPWKKNIKSAAVANPGAVKAVPGQAAIKAPRSAPKAEKGTAVLNFSDASLKDLLRAVSEITGTNFIIASGVTSPKISILSTSPIKKKDVFGIFETILDANGLAAVKSGDYYTIVSAPGAKQKGLDLYTDKNVKKIPAGGRMVSFLVPIKYISAVDIVQVLKPTLSQAGNITHYEQGNTLIITDVGANIRKYIRIINQLDVDLFERFNVTIVPVRNVDVDTLSKELGDIFQALGYDKGSNQLAIIPISRLNSLIVLSSSDKLLGTAKAWIEQFDVESSTGEISTHIYYVQNEKASNIKAVLDRIYGDLDGREAKTKQTAALKSFKVAKGAKPVKFIGNAKANVAEPAQATDIIVYEPSNALIIRSSEREYQQMLKTMKELDRQPKQVLIDALVVEVSLDESTQYGIQWSAITGLTNIHQNTGIIDGAVFDDPNIPLPISVTPDTQKTKAGMSIFVTDARNFYGVIQALSSDGKVKVLSNPHIVVRNYEKASITVGTDEPIATQSSQSATTGSSNILQSIEYRNTGIIMTVTPQITESGTVAMTIRQEISDVGASKTVGSGEFPSFTKRSAETSVVAMDGVPIVIAGLIQTREKKSESGIPLLRRIPIIGKLFSFTSVNEIRRELVLLLTPRVISNTEEATELTEEIKNKLNSLKGMLGDASQSDTHVTSE